MTSLNNYIILFCAVGLFACKSKDVFLDKKGYDLKQTEIVYKHEDGRRIIDANSQLEIIGSGFDWTEGPLYLDSEGILVFSDIPQNKIYSWDEKEGINLYLTPSGYTKLLDRKSGPGSNGLLLNQKNELILCQHGDRRVAKLDRAKPGSFPSYTTIVDNYKGKRLNSPNDIVGNSKGEYFFTDPPYGLDQVEGDVHQELSFYGIYKINSANELLLLYKDLRRPNGIALSPDEKELIVANSDESNPVWMSYDLSNQGTILNSHIFYDATEATLQYQGLPDGMVFSRTGILFASGPGGIWVFDQSGNFLVHVITDSLISNCTLSSKEDYLYITADNDVLRLPLNLNDLN